MKRKDRFFLINTLEVIYDLTTYIRIDFLLRFFHPERVHLDLVSQRVQTIDYNGSIIHKN
jgi:hypothetical protein